MFKKGFCKIFKKMIFKVPVIKKIENIAARLNARVWGQKLPIFQNLTPKNIPDRQKFVGFKNLRKRAKSLHPTEQDIWEYPYHAG